MAVARRPSRGRPRRQTRAVRHAAASPLRRRCERAPDRSATGASEIRSGPGPAGRRLRDLQRLVAGAQRFGPGRPISPTRSGTGSLRKTSNNDPNGGTTTLSRAAVGNDWRMSTWVYRPDPWSGGAQDRISVEDASGNGYGVRSIHNGTNRLQIERPTNTAGATSATTNYAAPKNEWYRLDSFARGDLDHRLRLRRTPGTLLATVSDTDGTHSTFDRVAVRGGRDYYLDDLEVTTSPPTFADQTGGARRSAPDLPPTTTTGLLVGDPDPAIDLGGDSRLDAPSRTALDGCGRHADRQRLGRHDGRHRTAASCGPRATPIGAWCSTETARRCGVERGRPGGRTTWS